MFQAQDRGRVAAQELVAALRAGDPVSIAHAVVEGDVELDAIDYPHPLVVRDTVFSGRFDVSDCRFAKRLDLAGCTFERAVNFAGARIGGRFVLERTTFQHDPASTRTDLRRIQVAGDLLASGLQTPDDLDLDYAHIAGGLWLRSTAERPTRSGGLVNLRGVQIQGEARLQGLVTGGDLRLVNANITGWMLLDVSEGHRARIGGDLWLHTARIGGKLTMGGIEVKGEVQAGGLSIGEGVYCAPHGGVTTEFGKLVSFSHARISGGVTLAGVVVGGDLVVADTTIQGGFVLHDAVARTRIEGSLMLFGTTVSASVIVSGAQIGGMLVLVNTSAQEFIADVLEDQRTEVGQAVLLNASRIVGSGGLGGARIGQDLRLDDAHLGGDLRCVSTANGIRTEIGGSLHAGSAQIGGHVLLDGAKIAGLISLLSAEVRGGISLGAVGEQRMEVTHVMLGHARVSSGVALAGARIAHVFNASGAELEGGLGCDGDGTEIGGPIVLERLRTSHLRIDGRQGRAGSLDLSLARIERLEIVGSLPARTDLAGCAFEQLTVPDHDVRGLLRTTTPFRRDPYIAMEKWLRDRGEDVRANEVYLDLRRRHRAENLRGLRRWADWALDASVRYGVASQRLVVYLVAVCCLSAVLFAQPGAIERDPPALGPPTWSAASWVSVQTVFPMFAVAAAKPWRPSARPIVVWERPLGLSHAGYASIVSLLSWIVVPLFIAGISGLLKKT
jgi:hypothetical protein